MGKPSKIKSLQCDFAVSLFLHSTVWRSSCFKRLISDHIGCMHMKLNTIQINHPTLLQTQMLLELQTVNAVKKNH